MVRYQRNNITFRIASSAAIAEFKRIQAHSFVQLSRKELNFHDGAKEVVLLSYDRFSQWIYRVERICLTAASQNKTSEDLVPALTASFIDEQRISQSVIESHLEVFSLPLVQYVKYIHTYTADMVSHHISTLGDLKVDSFYTQIVNMTNNYLQHILIAMHEFNNNMVVKSEPPFISVADFCASGDGENSIIIPCMNRLNFFRDQGCGDEYIFKNYIIDPILKEKVNENLSAWAEAHHYRIIKEVNEEG